MDVELTDERNSFYCNFLFSIYALGLFLATPVFGILSDSYKNRKIPMLIGLLGLSISTFIFPFAHTIPLLSLSRFCQGISAASSWVIGMALLCDVYPTHELGRVMGLVNGIYTLGFMGGPILGSVLTEATGDYKSPFYVCAALACLDLLGRLLIDPPKEKLVREVISTEEIDSVKNEPSHMNPILMHTRSFLNLFIIPQVALLCFVVILGASSFTIIESSLASHVQSEYSFGFSQNETTLLLLAIMLPSVLISIFVGPLSDRIPRSRLIFLGLLLHAPAPPLIVLSTTKLSLFLTAMYFGASYSVLNTPAQPEMASILSTRGNHTSYARIYAVFNIAYSVGMVLGPTISGFLKSYVSFLSAQCILAGSLLAFAPFFLVFSLKLERQHAKRPSDLRTVLKHLHTDFFTVSPIVKLSEIP